MIYLANGEYFDSKVSCTAADPRPEVVQQSKARHKEDFLNAFSPFIADASSVAYKGAPADVQGKLRRVVDVWRERSIFEKDVLQDLDNRLAGEYPNLETYLALLTLTPSQRSTRHVPQLTSGASAVTPSAPPRDLPSLQSSPPWLRRSRPSLKLPSP